MLAARGLVDGSPVVAFCSDPTVMGGAMGDLGCKAVLVAYSRAMQDEVPIVGLWHSGGARLAEGVLSLHAEGEIFHRSEERRVVKEFVSTCRSGWSTYP